MSKTKTKRVKRWAIVDGVGAVGALYSTRPSARPGVRVARLVEHLPGDVVLSREDVLAVVDAIARDLVDEGFDEDDAPTFCRVATSAILRGRR